MKKFITILLSTIYLIVGAQTSKVPVDGYPRFALGADVSWTPYIESNSIHSYTVDGVATTVDAMLFDYGVDAVRLRVWVDPASDKARYGFTYNKWGSTNEVMGTFGTCSTDYIVEMASRVAAQGQRLMVAFHFSDTWADPGHQFIPESWSDCTTAEQLAERAAEHVRNVLEALFHAKVNVTWVQIGNETNVGMLAWDVPTDASTEVKESSIGCGIGQVSPLVPNATTYNFVRTFRACAVAAREIYPEALTVIHLANAQKWSDIDWTLGLLKETGLDAEMCSRVGLSLYPGIELGPDFYTSEWKQAADAALSTIDNIYSKYGFRSILCEVGMPNEYSYDTDKSTHSLEQAAHIARCNSDVAAFTRYLLDNLDTEQSTCDGLFYWEPETDYLMDYPKGACVAAEPSQSWNRQVVTPNAWWDEVKSHSTFPSGGLKDFDPALIEEIPAEETEATFYDLRGVKVDPTTVAPGIYLRRTASGTAKVVIKKGSAWSM